MKKSKLAKVLTVSLAALMVFGLASCGGGSGKVSDKDITVISREEGSGTRDAFTELTGVLQDDVDKTVDTAEISNSTSVVTQSVAGKATSPLMTMQKLTRQAVLREASHSQVPLPYLR